MNTIKRLRMRRNLTQQQLADRIGVDIRTVQRWEAQDSIRPRIVTLVTLALAAR